jgi:flagellar biosynthesis/type III secretory pathway ATPase
MLLHILCDSNVTAHPIQILTKRVIKTHERALAHFIAKIRSPEVNILHSRSALFSHVLLKRKPHQTSHFKDLSNIYKTSKRAYHAESLKDFCLKFSLQKE